MAIEESKRSDGSAGAPVMAAATGGRNSALKEAAAWKEGDGVDRDHVHAARVRIVDAQHAVVDAGPSPRKRIAICGFASSSRHFIPVNDPSWEIWGLNQLYRHIARADRWFDIHRNWNEEVVPGTDHHGWIRDSGIPVYMMDLVPGLDTSVRYPVERIIEKFGVDYFTSTIAFAVALALDEIDQRVDARIAHGDLLARGGDRDPRAAIASLYGEYEIGLFGIDLVVGEEYDWQKACAEFWLGAAAVGRGIRVFLPPQSALVKQLFRYGYEAEPQSVIKLSEVAAHKAALEKQKVDGLRHIYMIDGALQADDYWQQLMTLRLRGADVAG